ncbi:MAG: cytochrome b/b6 domain-containing protein [Deltaproteobacteria bacterium]|nr:cytochrome b/b6 domain-containing protein [Deltaproteobacteria bacterium]
MRQLVYDLPTRLFHWGFSGLFLTAFVIAKIIDDDSPIFSYHSLAGLTLGFLVLLRIIWGFAGTKHSKFSGFVLHPRELLNYFKDIVTGHKKRWAGHNPASSWAALTMMAMALGLGITGYLMTSGPDKETFEDVHELLANGFIVVAILHVLGIVLHTIRYKEMIGLSMIDGKKADVLAAETIDSPRTAFGILLIGLVVAFGIQLYRNYDTNTQSLQLFGTTLRLGEGEAGENDGAKEDGAKEEGAENSADDDDD